MAISRETEDLYNEANRKAEYMRERQDRNGEARARYIFDRFISRFGWDMSTANGGDKISLTSGPTTASLPERGLRHGIDSFASKHSYAIHFEYDLAMDEQRVILIRKKTQTSGLESLKKMLTHHSLEYYSSQEYKCIVARLRGEEVPQAIRTFIECKGWKFSINNRKSKLTVWYTTKRGGNYSMDETRMKAMLDAQQAHHTATGRMLQESAAYKGTEIHKRMLNLDFGETEQRVIVGFDMAKGADTAIKLGIDPDTFLVKPGKLDSHPDRPGYHALKAYATFHDLKVQEETGYILKICEPGLASMLSGRDKYGLMSIANQANWTWREDHKTGGLVFEPEEKKQQEDFEALGNIAAKLKEEEKMEQVKVKTAHSVNVLMDAIAIRCVFDGSSKEYSYKTLLQNLEEGDKVIVEGSRGCTIVTVTEVIGAITEANTKHIVGLGYSNILWAFQAVDLTKLKALQDAESDMTNTIKTAGTNKENKEMVDELKENLSDKEFKALKAKANAVKRL